MPACQYFRRQASSTLARPLHSRGAKPEDVLNTAGRAVERREQEWVTHEVCSAAAVLNKGEVSAGVGNGA
jgi:hypothetical protein